MRKALKGALLSALVLPGLGQLVFKQYLRGIAFMLAILAGLVFVVVQATQAALKIVGEIDSATGSADLNQLVTSANQAVANVDTASSEWVLPLIVCAWLFSIVDAYLIGRRLDQQAGSSAPGKGGLAAL